MTPLTGSSPFASTQTLLEGDTPPPYWLAAPNGWRTVPRPDLTKDKVLFDNLCIECYRDKRMPLPVELCESKELRLKAQDRLYGLHLNLLSIPLHSLLFDSPALNFRVESPPPDWSDAMLPADELAKQVELLMAE